MTASSGNRRIALALLVLVGSAVALHVHEVRVYGPKPIDRQAAPGRSKHLERKFQAEGGAKHGTQSKRIVRHIQNP